MIILLMGYETLILLLWYLLAATTVSYPVTLSCPGKIDFKRRLKLTPVRQLVLISVWGYGRQAWYLFPLRSGEPDSLSASSHPPKRSSCASHHSASSEQKANRIWCHCHF